MSTESITEALNPEATKDSGKPEGQPGSLRDLFYFASRAERYQVLVAIVLSTLQGAILPVFTVLMLTMGSDFSEVDSAGVAMTKLTDSIKLLGSFAAFILVSSFVSSALWSSLSTSQATKIKSRYLQGLMHQNTQWFDAHKTEEIASNYVHEVSNLGIVFSQKLHFYFMYYAQMIAGILICFYVGWIYSLVTIFLLPFMGIFLYLFVRNANKAEAVQKRHESRATMLFENAINLIKPIKAICGEEQEISRFNALSENMRASATKLAYRAGIYWGFVNFSGYAATTLALLFGCKLLEYRYFNSNAGRVYSASDILAILFSLLPPIASMGNIGMLEQFIRSGANTVRKIINISSQLTESGSQNALPQTGETKLTGTIEFHGVSFSYPSNPKTKVLNNFSLKIKSGEKVAVVGPSGCGKTTIIQLLERFYEPTNGTITIDGIDIRQIDLKYLRSRIGLVSQQSLLFTGTVRENLLMGISSEQLPDEKIWDILDKVNGRSFVERLPGKLDAIVGGSGSGLLSNGQKQKLSIARCLLKDPIILLFDEATNFLDKQEEQEVRSSIELIAQHCTTIVIDHKMGKTQSMDMVYVLDHGVLVESGAPADLLARKDSAYGKAVHDKEKSDESAKENVMDISMDSRAGADPSYRNIFKFVENSGVPQEPSEADQVNTAEEAWVREVDQLPWRSKVSEALHSSRSYVGWSIVVCILNGCVVTLFGYLIGRVRVELSSLASIQEFPDDGLSSAASQSFLARRKVVQKSLDESLIMLLVVGLLSMILNFLQVGFLSQVTEKIVSFLRSSYFRKMMYLDIKFLDQPEFHPGHLALGLNKSTAFIKTGISYSLGSLLQMAASLLFGLLILATFSIYLALAGALVSLVIMIFKKYESRFAGYYATLSREMNLKVLAETLGSMRLVRSLNAEEKMVLKFSEVSPQERAKRFRMSLLAGLVFGLSQLVNYIGYGVFMAFGLIYRNEMGVTVSEVMACVLTMVVSMYGVIVAQDHLADFDQAVRAIKSLVYPLFYTSAIEQDPTALVPSHRKPIINWVDKIEFKNVEFRYSDKGKMVLRGLNLTIPSGSITGVFGRSGSGKSAIVELLLRFYDPTAGTILINDVPIQDIDLHHLRMMTGALLQDTRLFNDPIDTNIRGTKELTDYDVRELASLTNSLNFIFASPEGFKRVVGQFGQNLSGGQRQRILLSRFFGRLGKINVLDEPTSALDLTNEKKILSALEKVKGERATVVLSSKPNTFAACDKIAVLSGGRIVEIGSEAELMEKRGKFWSMTRK